MWPRDHGLGHVLWPVLMSQWLTLSHCHGDCQCHTLTMTEIVTSSLWLTLSHCHGDCQCHTLTMTEIVTSSLWLTLSHCHSDCQCHTLTMTEIVTSSLWLTLSHCHSDCQVSVTHCHRDWQLYVLMWHRHAHNRTSQDAIAVSVPQDEACRLNFPYSSYPRLTASFTRTTCR